MGSLKDLFYRSSPTPEPTPEPATEAEPEAPPVAPRVASGPLGARRSAPAVSGLRRSGLAKVNAEKLSNLRKRVLGTEPTAFTQVLEQAAALEEAGIADATQRYRGAIKTARITKGDLVDAVASHKTSLLQQREGFAKHIGGLRDTAANRQKEIEAEKAQLEQRFAELETEYAALVQKQQELDANEQEFTQVADALDAEITQTGDQIAALFT